MKINKFKRLGCFLLMAVMMTLLAACTAAPKQTADTADNTSGTKTYKVAIVQHIDHPSLNQIRETIKSEFKELGLDGKVEIIEKNANGDASMLPSIMQSLAAENVDMIIPIATPTAQAAAAATSTIAIVFSAVSTPIEAGLVTSFEDTSKNITGVSNSIPIEEIFKLAAQLTPNVKTFGFVYNPSEVNSATGIERAKAYCDANGLKYKEATVGSTADIQQASASLANEVDAFFTPNDNMVASAMPTYLQVATNAKKPIYVGADSMVADGGLATVGIDYVKLGKQTAQMAQRIINGASIKDTHVEAIQEFAKMINTNTSKELGIEIPESIKAEFEEVNSLD